MFPPTSTYVGVLKIKNKEYERIFAYGTIALYGRLFQAVWLGAKFVTLFQTKSGLGFPTTPAPISYLSNKSYLSSL